MPLFSISGRGLRNLGIHGSRFAPCPGSPNCVSSDTTEPSRAVQPFGLSAAPVAAWRTARNTVAALPRTRIVRMTENYLHAECRSRIFGFVDDLELHLRSAAGIIAVRSAARLGYSDFGVNRRRVERLRAALAARGIVRPPGGG